MKTLLATLALTLVAASAHADVLTFAGSCQLSVEGKAFTTTGSFELVASPQDCPHADMEFTVTEASGAKSVHGIYLEFQRSEFGPGLIDKAFVSHYDKSVGSL